MEEAGSAVSGEARVPPTPHVMQKPQDAPPEEYRWQRKVCFLLDCINTVYLVTGALLVLTGAILIVSRVTIDVRLQVTNEEQLSDASCLIKMCVGSLLMSLSLLGLCGTSNRSKSFLLAYTMILFALLIGAFFFFYFIVEAMYRRPSLLAVHIAGAVQGAMRRYRKSTSSRWLVDFVQQVFGCCGWETHGDWYALNNNTIPHSCCVHPVTLPLTCRLAIGGGAATQRHPPDRDYLLWSRGCVHTTTYAIDTETNLLVLSYVFAVLTLIIEFLLAFKLVTTSKSKVSMQ